MSAARTLLIVGDSISLGVAETIRSEVLSRVAVPYVQTLQQICPDWKIIVDAEVHRTTTATVPLIQSLLARHRPDAVFFLLGGNDADVSWRRFIATEGKQSRSQVTSELFGQNLRTLGELTLATGAVPILGDVCDCDVARRGLWLTKQTGRNGAIMFANGGGQEEADRRCRSYVAAVNEAAAALDVPVVRWGQQMLEVDLAARLSIDGYHPGDAAHAVIAQTIAEVLISLRVPPRASVKAQSVLAPHCCGD